MNFDFNGNSKLFEGWNDSQFVIKNICGSLKGQPVYMSKDGVEFYWVVTIPGT
jgi:hypothetical protein